MITQNSCTTQRFAAGLGYTDKTQLEPTFTAQSKVFISKISVKYFPLTHNKYSITLKKIITIQNFQKKMFYIT